MLSSCYVRSVVYVARAGERRGAIGRGAVPIRRPQLRALFAFSPLPLQRAARPFLVGHAPGAPR
eukprot:3397083-Lingulodinium_polyedra.AAC.1